MELAISLEQWTWLSVTKLQASLRAPSRLSVTKLQACLQAPSPQTQYKIVLEEMTKTTSCCHCELYDWFFRPTLVLQNYLLSSLLLKLFVFSIHRPPQCVTFSKNLYFGSPHSLSHCNNYKWDFDKSVLESYNLVFQFLVSFSPACALEIHLQKKKTWKFQPDVHRYSNQIFTWGWLSRILDDDKLHVMLTNRTCNQILKP